MTGLIQSRQLKKTALTLIVMVLLTLAVGQRWIEHLTDSHWVVDYLHHGGLAALGWLSGVGVLFTAAGGPRQVLAFVFGYAFGGWTGMLLATLITGAGAALCFLLARTLLADTLQHRFRQRLARLQATLETHTALKVLIIRLLPVGSNLVTNMLAGATRIRLLPFLLGSVIGYLPQMAVFGLLGSGVGVSDHQQLILSVVLFIVASAIGFYIYRTRFNRSVSALATNDL